MFTWLNKFIVKMLFWSSYIKEIDSSKTKKKQTKQQNYSHTEILPTKYISKSKKKKWIWGFLQSWLEQMKKELW